MTKIIGLCGRAGCGKDLAATILWQEVMAHRMAFAEPLYEAISVITKVGVTQYQDREFKETVIPWIGKSPRYLLQTLGTEWGRKLVGEDFWVNILKQRIERIEWWNGITRDIVITDVRFENEAKMIKEIGGEVWQINRPGTAAVLEHVSENGISESYIDKTLLNSSGIDEFRGEVMCAYRGGA